MVANLVRWPLLVVLLMIALGVIDKVIPERDNPQFRWVIPGSIDATVCCDRPAQLCSACTRKDTTVEPQRPMGQREAVKGHELRESASPP